MFRVRSLIDDTSNNATNAWRNENNNGDPSSLRVTNCDTEDCDDDDGNDNRPYGSHAIVIFDDEKIPIEYTCDSNLKGTDDEEWNVDVYGGRGGGNEDDEYEESSSMMYTTTSSTITDSQQPRLVLSETQVSVDYEALIPLVADTKANERMLQWRILLAAIEEIGLDKCNFDQQRQRQGGDDDDDDDDSTRRLGQHQHQQQQQPSSRRRQRRRLDPLLEAPLTVYAIRSDLVSSSPMDFSCLNLEPDPVTQCVPVRTVLTLKYQGTTTMVGEGRSGGNGTNDDPAAAAIQQYVTSLLERAMVDRTKELLVGDVEGLQYVGTFDLAEYNTNGGSSPSASPPSPPTTLAVDTTGGGSDGDAIMRIGTVISAASAVALLLFLFVFRRRGPAREDEEGEEPNATAKGAAPTEAELQSEIQQDLESGTNIGSRGAPNGAATTATNRMMVSTTNTNLSAAATSTERMSSPSDGYARHDRNLILTVTSSGDSLERLERNPPPLRTKTSEENEADDEKDFLMVDLDSMRSGSADSGDRPPAHMMETHSLPPRPPRRESVQLKTHRRRRKKKRKKIKATLKRINSREKINAMEAIPETADDGSELEESEEDGSEYSTGTEDEEEDDDDDDDHSNLSSSTSSTPVRLPGSKSGSPVPTNANAHKSISSNHGNGGTTTNNNNNSGNSSGSSFFPAHSFVQDFNFVIEALDFPFGRRNSDNNDNNNNNRKSSKKDKDEAEEQQQHQIPPTIEEEQRIRPIPPPWI